MQYSPGDLADECVVTVGSRETDFWRHFTPRAAKGRRFFRINIDQSNQDLEAERQRVEKILANTAGRIKQFKYIDHPGGAFFFGKFTKPYHVIDLHERGINIAPEIADLKARLIFKMQNIFLLKSQKKFLIITGEGKGKLHAETLKLLENMRFTIKKMHDRFPTSGKRQIAVTLFTNPDFSLPGTPNTLAEKKRIRAAKKRRQSVTQ